MLDQLIIGKKGSFDDFCASVATRASQPPEKKSIKETVPFSNVTYDFSKINGELYWEERELQYAFEIIADSPAALECKKAAFANWVMNVMQEKLFDPFEPDFHYIGTFESMNFDDDESMEKTTATVTFKAYPYKIANSPSNYVFVIPARGAKTVVVENESGHRIAPTVTVDNAVTITKNGASYVFSAGTSSDSIFTLDVGANLLTINNAESADCTVKFSFYREVF